MNSRIHTITLALGIAACCGLGWQWWHSNQQLRSAAARLAKVEGDNVRLESQLAALNKRNQAIAEQTAASVRIQEEAAVQTSQWDASVSAAIAALKRKHELSPPPLKKPSPPRVEGGSFYIYELLGDPEYYLLVKKLLRPSDERFEKLGLSPEVKDKVADLLAEVSVLHSAVWAAPVSKGETSQEERRAIMKARDEKEKRILNEVKQLMGDEAYAKYQPPAFDPQDMGKAEAEYILEKLRRRLSYTDTPLNKVQAEQLLGQIMANIRREKYPRLPNNVDEILKQSGVLLGGQVVGLDELMTEQKAEARRNKLPRVETSPMKK
jgi:hypothetical protein